MLFGIEPLDPPTFAAVAIGFTAVAAVASYLPARRATARRSGRGTEAANRWRPFDSSCCASSRCSAAAAPSTSSRAKSTRIWRCSRSEFVAQGHVARRCEARGAARLWRRRSSQGASARCAIVSLDRRSRAGRRVRAAFAAPEPGVHDRRRPDARHRHRRHDRDLQRRRHACSFRRCRFRRGDRLVTITEPERPRGRCAASTTRNTSSGARAPRRCRGMSALTFNPQVIMPTREGTARLTGGDDLRRTTSRSWA